MTSHYANGSDSATWSGTGTGSVTRNVIDLSGALAAKVTDSGSPVLQLENLHGDIAVTLNLDGSGTATVSRYDEYGNIQDGTTALAFGWLGSYQLTTDTASAVSVMGARLYSASTGRFLQVDPIYSGSANAYDYCNGDGSNCTDLDGTCPSGWRHITANTLCTAAIWAAATLITAVGESLCLAYAAGLLWACSAIVGGLADAVSYYVETRWDGGFTWSNFFQKFVVGAAIGLTVGGIGQWLSNRAGGRKAIRRIARYIIKVGKKLHVRRVTSVLARRMTAAL
jgi:RHS repeat-associated protein